MTNYFPVADLISKFGGELAQLFNDTCNSARDEIRAIERREAIDLLYEDGAITNFTNMRVSKENYKVFNNIFKLMDSFDDVKKSEKITIETLGQERGFSIEESHVIYNLKRFESALTNLRSQREAMVEYILAEA